jgi:lysylphosphatidylglycerol synthetase-like protein (DUF2156 family)
MSSLMDKDPHEDAERIARLFHDWYEAMAPRFGWETQRRSREKWMTCPRKTASSWLPWSTSCYARR